MDELSLPYYKKIYQRYRDGELHNVAWLDKTVDEPLSTAIVYDFVRQPSLWHSPTNLVNNLIKDLEK